MISPSQAVRVYKAGARLRYACEIYNAAQPVQMTISVWRDTQKCQATGEIDPLTPLKLTPSSSLIFVL